MTVEQWRRISAIFAAAQALPPADRGAYLEVACSRHPEDRPQLESLLASGDSGSEPGAALAPGGLVTVAEPGLPSGPFEPGQQVARYRVRRPIAGGGMGMLYVAEDNLHREVVLKVVSPALAADPQQRARLRHEAEVMARLNHAGIANVFAFEEIEGVSFLVSEFVRGANLREHLDRYGPYGPSELAGLAIGIGEALGAAHRCGIVHRDIKPENIMLPEDGGVKIVDFGIARVEAADWPTHLSMTGQGTILGTLAYMAPEQIQGLRVDLRCDLFAMGVLIYEAATGTHPFAGRGRFTTMSNILQLEPPPLASRRPLAFGPLEQIVARCLRKAPDQRYASAQELVSDLRAAQEHFRGSSASSVFVPPSARSPSAPVTPQGGTRPVNPQDPLGWWRFHQVAVSVFYGVLLAPLWIVRERLAPGPARDLVFFGALAATVVSIMLRLHAAFVARHSPEILDATRWRTRAATLVTDGLVVACLTSGAVLVLGTKPGLAALLLSGALGTLVALLVIEPATSGAAFGDRKARSPRP